MHFHFDFIKISSADFGELQSVSIFECANAFDVYIRISNVQNRYRDTMGIGTWQTVPTIQINSHLLSAFVDNFQCKHTQFYIIRLVCKCQLFAHKQADGQREKCARSAQRLCKISIAQIFMQFVPGGDIAADERYKWNQSFDGRHPM